MLAVKMSRSAAVLALVLYQAAAAGSDSEEGSAERGEQMPESMRSERVPPRPADAVSGSGFARRTAEMPVPEREAAALLELRRGNIPEFLRNLRPVQLRGGAACTGVESPTAIVWVMPDYLAIGSDDDFLRLPLSFPAAVTVAEEFGFALPTPKIVDAIYEQSALHLEPQPMTPGRSMCSMGYFLRHQQMIEEQRQGRRSGELVAGHKKDLVLTKRLRQQPGRVAIYGWHRLNGEPIQPLSIVHGEGYADYSHGVRLVSQTVWLAGEGRSIFEVLQDTALAPLLTREGVMEDANGSIRRQP